MADDIDIEEHDVMDNSLVKGMFPDLSIVKTELIFDDEDEEEPAYEDHTNSTYTGIPDSTTDIFDTVAPRTAESPHIVSSTQEGFAKPDPFNNRIILGTKRKVIVDDDVDLDHCYSATVVLKDWESYLSSSNSYCQECEILFATVNALDAHKMTVHSFLVAVEPTFSGTAEKPPIPEPELKTRHCFVCKKVFTDETELIKHIYEHIESTKGTAADPLSPAYQCDMCLSYYRRMPLFENHMQVNHKTKPSDFERVPINLNCAFCKKKFDFVKQYNNHIACVHRKLYYSARNVAQPKLVVKKTGVKLSATSKVPPKPGMVTVRPKSEVRYIPKATLFKCFKCDVHMTNYAVSKIHHASCSRKLPGHCKCNQCKLIISKASIGDHVIQHKFADNFDIHDVGFQDLDSRILNKCPDCEIYFTENNFQLHLKKCQKTESFKCTECHLTIESAVQITHEMLHQTSIDDFILIDYVPVNSPTSLGTLGKIPVTNVKKYTLYICKHCSCALTQGKGWLIQKHIDGHCKTLHKAICKYCGLYFTPYLLQQHYKMHFKHNDYNLNNFKLLQLDNHKVINPIPQYPKCNSCQIHVHATTHHRCNMEKYKTCPVCKLKFNLKTIKLHMAFHQIPLGCIKTKIEMKKEVKEESEGFIKYSRKRKGYVLYYCNVCKGCLHKPSHAEGKNVRCTDIKQYTCNQCGLMFTCKSLITHRAWHRSKNGGSLHDIRIYNLDGYKIAPPLPTYFKCSRCAVFFYSKRSLKMHKKNQCKFQEFKTCSICNIKLCIQTYALHMPFHEYSENTIVKTEPDATQDTAEASNEDLVLHYCEKCKCCFPKRFTHMGKMEVFCGKSPKHVCDWCGLTFTRSIYDMHRQIHAARKVVLQDFTFYRLKDKVQIAPPISEDSYVSCQKCAVLLHTKMARRCHDCDDAVKTCNICNLDFNPKTYELHMAFHKYKIQNEEIIASPPQIKYKMYQCAKCHCCYRRKRSMVSHLENECGKVLLNKCPRCNLLLKDTRPHIAFHDSNPDFTRENIETININSAKDLEVGKKDVYQCSVCKYVAFTYMIMKKHKLKCKKTLIGPSFCKICQFNFGKTQQSTHKRFHEEYPDATRLDFNVMPFNPTNKINDYFSYEKKKKIGTKKPSRVTKHQFYQCTTCRFICFSAPIRKHHKYTCKIFPQKQCNKCGLPIRIGQSKMHRNMHALYPDMTPENITVIPFRYSDNNGKHVLTDLQVDNEPLSEKITLYKCRTCLRVLSGKRNNMFIYLRKHVTQLCKGFITPMSTCEICKLSFHKNHIATHRRIHDIPPYNNPDNIRIIEFDKSDYMRAAPEENVLDESNEIDVISESHDFSESALAEDETFNDNENLDDTIVDSKYVLFKCNICKSCMSWDSVKHKRTKCHLITPQQLRKCPICHNSFHFTCINKHMKKHMLNPDMIPENIKIVLFGDIKRISEIYQCKQCEVHFLSKEKAIEHLDEDHALNSDICTCHCGLSFLEIDLETHRHTHHDGDKNESTDLTIKDINVLSNKLPVDEVRPSPVDEERPSPLREERPSPVREGRRKRKYNGEFVGSPTLTKMYQCDCDLVFLCRASLKEHQGTCNGESDVGLKCSKCELSFDSNQLLRHSLKHHSIVSHVKYVMVKCTLEEARAKIENRKIQPVAAENDLFYCNRCHVCFLKKSTLEKHLYDHATFKQVLPCEHCGITFTKYSLDKHLVLHHEDKDFNFFNIRNVYFKLLEVRPAKIEKTENVDAIKETTSEEVTEKATSDITEKSPAEIKEKVTVGTGENAAREEIKIEAAIEIKEKLTAEIKEKPTAEIIVNTTTEITENAQIREATKEIKDNTIENNSTPNNAKMISKETIKTLNYYKCRDCEVIFLNEEASHLHAVNHAPLTDFDYMECKVCKLNYVLDSLKQHMIQHKNNEFSLETAQIHIVDPKPPLTLLDNEINDLQKTNDVADDLIGTKLTKTCSENNNLNGAISNSSSAEERTAVERKDNSEINNEKKSENFNIDRVDKIVVVYK